MRQGELDLTAKRNVERPIKKTAKGRPREFDRVEALEKALAVFWEKGFEPATLPELCAAMGINPPSLYAAFGNKTALFLEAVEHYAKKYWTEPCKRFQEQPDLKRAVRDFFMDAANLLVSPQHPCGCVIILGTVNISPDETEIIAAMAKLRQETREMFLNRLRQAIRSGQIRADTDAPALANALNAYLDGMALEAKNGLFLTELRAMASLAVKLLPE